MNLCHSPTSTLITYIATLMALIYHSKGYSILSEQAHINYAEPMRTKCQIFNTFQKFICRVELQLEKKLKYLCSNFGGEFANQAFEKYTAKEGIK